MIRSFGGTLSCARRASARRFNNFVTSVCATRCDFIRNRPEFSHGGIIECWPFQKIADFASTRCSQVNRSRKSAPRPASIGKCAKAKILPITRRFGQNSICEARLSSAAKVTDHLGWRMSFLPAVDRALERNHARESRLRNVATNRRTISRDFARAI